MPRAAKKSPAPNALQLETLQKMASSPDGRLIYLKGGFWTCRGIATHTPTYRHTPGVVIPEWYISAHTVKAMESRGWIARANVHAEDWRDERQLTDIGRSFVPQTEVAV